MKFSPQEIEVWYVIPEIRKQLALSLKNQGLSQKEIAARLDVSEATISHYAKNRRAGNFDFNSRIIRIIESSAKKIAKTKSKTEVMKQLQVICREVRKDCLCSIHKSIEKVPKCCAICSQRQK